jgi:hypothetical protein
MIQKYYTTGAEEQYKELRITEKRRIKMEKKANSIKNK